jgi:phosphohistidine phosphatase
MRRLILLRHAKSSWTEAGQTDIERGLAERGIEAAPKMASYMRAEGLVPDRVLVSAATRTQATWALMAPELGGSPEVLVDRAIYEAAPRDLLTAVERTPDHIKTLLMVGHNPGLQLLGLHLARRDGAETRKRLNEKFPTAALLVLDLNVEDWIDLPPESAIIDRYETPARIGAVPVDE